MKIMQWIAFFFIVIVLLMRGFSPGLFNLDQFSISLLFLLAIPLLAPYLKEAKWFGAEFAVENGYADEIIKNIRRRRRKKG